MRPMWASVLIRSAIPERNAEDPAHIARVAAAWWQYTWRRKTMRLLRLRCASAACGTPFARVELQGRVRWAVSVRYDFRAGYYAERFNLISAAALISSLRSALSGRDGVDELAKKKRVQTRAERRSETPKSHLLYVRVQIAPDVLNALASVSQCQPRSVPCIRWMPGVY
ncbi:hypothetical protein BC834DRAFT_609674 [Gloeopeniophorella convolvens]|nr:hypothetical protein BC834DRAFT_609674 [Gloeopeniophorella convolvens]